MYETVEKFTSPIPHAQIRKSPYGAQADRIPDARKREVQLPPPFLSRIFCRCELWIAFHSGCVAVNVRMMVGINERSVGYAQVLFAAAVYVHERRSGVFRAPLGSVGRDVGKKNTSGSFVMTSRIVGSCDMLQSNPKDIPNNPIWTKSVITEII